MVGFSYLHQNDAENIVLHFQQVCISQVHKANQVDEIVGGNWKMMLQHCGNDATHFLQYAHVSQLCCAVSLRFV